MQLTWVAEVGSCDYKCSVCLYGSSILKTTEVIIFAFSSSSSFLWYVFGCVYGYLHVSGVCMLTYACSTMLVLEGQKFMEAFFFSLNIFFALFLKTGFLNGLSAGSSLFCLDWTACKSQRSSCLYPSVLGLHVHIPCPTFFLWVLGIHTQVPMLVQQVLYWSTISPALFFLILSLFLMEDYCCPI